MSKPFRTKHPGKILRSPLWAIAASIVFVAAVLAVLNYFGVDQQVIRLLKWFEAQGAWVSLLFILIMAVVVLLLLPGVLFTVGAGFAFGVVEGSVYVVLGTTLGATVAFLIARYLFGRRARQFVLSHSRLHLVSEEVKPHGWKIVLLTRLIPFFPSKLSNYFFGLTPFSLRGYVGGSLLGFIPFSVHNVYLGSIAADLSNLGVHQVGRSPLQWGLYGAGFIAAVLAVVTLSRLAQRALARYEEQGEIIEEDPL
ncbi:MAG: TVP38/TMEM64 family protein [Pseudomonadota bacterium]|nr:TVP38/TMEM64 family protein [Pseudomonadota bacterium]